MLGASRVARLRLADRYQPQAPASFPEINTLNGNNHASYSVSTCAIDTALDQIDAFGLALATFARQRRAFELRYVAEQAEVHGALTHLGQEITRLDTRIDRAADAFANLLRNVTIRLDGSDVITDAQASDIKALVRAIAKERTAPSDTTGTQYRALWSSTVDSASPRMRASRSASTRPSWPGWRSNSRGRDRRQPTTPTYDRPYRRDAQRPSLSLATRRALFSTLAALAAQNVFIDRHPAYTEVFQCPCAVREAGRDNRTRAPSAPS